MQRPLHEGRKERGLKLGKRTMENSREKRRENC